MCDERKKDYSIEGILIAERKKYGM